MSINPVSNTIISPPSCLNIETEEGLNNFIKLRLFFIGRQFGLIQGNDSILQKMFQKRISFFDLEIIKGIGNGTTTVLLPLIRNHQTIKNEVDLICIEKRIKSCEAKKREFLAAPLIFLSVGVVCAMVGLTALGMLAAAGSACFIAIGIYEYLSGQHTVFDEMSLRRWETLKQYYLPELNETPKNPV